MLREEFNLQESVNGEGATTAGPLRVRSMSENAIYRQLFPVSAKKP